MLDLASFIETYAVDSQIYVVLRGVNPEHSFELWWRQSGGSMPWQLRRRGHTAWTLANKKTLLSSLLQQGVDMDLATTELTRIALNQVVFAATVMREAEDLFGRTAVTQAVDEHKAFLERLIQSTRNLIEEKKGKTSQPTPMAHLDRAKPSAPGRRSETPPERPRSSKPARRRTPGVRGHLRLVTN